MSMKVELFINIQDDVIEIYNASKDKYGFKHVEDMISYAVGVGIKHIEKGEGNTSRLAAEELLPLLMFRRESEEYLGMSKQAFQKYISDGRIVPAKEFGEGKGKTQIFWKSDLDKIKK